LFRLSVTRFLNLLRILAGYILSRIMRRVIHFGRPVAVSIEPTNACNLHCPECPSGMRELTRARGNMKPEMFSSVIEQLSPTLSYLTLYFQGEPYLSPHFFEFVKVARARQIYVSTSTNGHFLGPAEAEATVLSGLNRLIISVDGTDQESYAAYRAGGSLQKVIDGIGYLARARQSLGRKNPAIIVQFLVLKSNEHQVPLIRKLAREWGADKVELKSAQFYDFEKGNPLMTTIGKYARYEKTPKGEARYRLRNTLPRHCFRMWSSCVITWDGKVVPCCFDKDATHPMGDLATQSFAGVWTGDAYQKFRQRILSEREKIGICTNCSEGTGLSRYL
jgi:radical SAM protein with 4Fe4S-binding SPASM domain